MAGGRDRQDAWEGYGKAWSIIGTLLAGLAVWGALGFLVDRLTGLHGVFLAVGLSSFLILIGVVGGLYAVLTQTTSWFAPKAFGGGLLALIPVAFYEAYLARRGRVAELIVDADRAATAARSASAPKEPA